MAESAHLHEDIQPLAWLLGRWRGEAGRGEYPTIPDFPYGEEFYFYHTGAHYIHFQQRTWHAETKTPLHLEAGFIIRQPGTNKVAMTIATNIGFAEIEEGELCGGEELRTESRSCAAMSTLERTATKIKRIIRRDGDDLVQTLYMETPKTPMTQHLHIRYKKITEDSATVKVYV